MLCRINGIVRFGGSVRVIRRSFRVGDVHTTPTTPHTATTDLDFDAVRSQQSCGTRQFRDTGTVQIALINGIQTLNVRIPALLQDIPIKGGRGILKPVLMHVVQGFGNAGRVPHDFFRDAPHIDASPTQPCIFHNGHFGPVRGGTTGRGNPTTPGPNDQIIVIERRRLCLGLGGFRCLVRRQSGTGAGARRAGGGARRDWGGHGSQKRTPAEQGRTAANAASAAAAASQRWTSRPEQKAGQRRRPSPGRTVAMTLPAAILWGSSGPRGGCGCSGGGGASDQARRPGQERHRGKDLPPALPEHARALHGGRVGWLHSHEMSEARTDGRKF